QLCLHRLPGTQVPQYSHEDTLCPLLEFPEGQLHREHRTIAPLPLDFCPPPDDLARARGARVLQACCLRTSRVRWHQPGDIGAYHVRRAIAEHGFSSRIARPDEAVTVNGDDGGPGGLYKATETRLIPLLCATHHITLYEHQATNSQYGAQTHQDERGLCRDA